LIAAALGLGLIAPHAAEAQQEDSAAVRQNVEAVSTPVRDLSGSALLPDDPGSTIAQRSAPPALTAMSDAGAQGGDQDPLSEGRQTKRILYVVPNFRAVSADTTLPPQSVKDKLVTSIQDSLDYSSFIFFGGQAGLGLLGNSFPEFGGGAVGYGRYYWHTLADGTDENLWVEFLIPTVLHEDTRYYTMGKGSIVKRFAYAITRIAITRQDDGGEAFNAGEIVGAGAAAGISNFYYPAQERTLTKTYQRWVTNILIDGGVFVFKEAWPSVNNKFFHQQN
jgi:hypothetical protein